MKRTILHLTCTLLLPILTAGCSSDPYPDSPPVAARITSTIDGMATRATGTTWAPGDAIGITQTSGTMKCNNRKYVTLSGNGVFTPDGGASNNIYFQNQDDVTFTAYYPYTGENGTSAGVINANTKVQTPEGQAKFDFLFATATGSSANPDVPFQFKHCMSRLTLNFQPGEGISSLSDLEYWLSSLNTEGRFDTTTGEAKVILSSQVQFYETVPFNASVMSSSLILFPQAKTRATIEIIMGGVYYRGTINFPTYPGSSTDNGMEAGKCYIYNVKVNNTGLTISPATVDVWEPGSSQNIDSHD